MRRKGFWGVVLVLMALLVLSATFAVAAEKVYINGIDALPTTFSQSHFLTGLPRISCFAMTTVLWSLAGIVRKFEIKSV